MKLLVTLPVNRAYSGYFVGTDDAGKVLCHGRCLGKADNGRAAQEGNPERDSRKPFGDTPTGDYAPTRAVIYALTSKTYGKGHIDLDGLTGDAMAAVEGGRTGIWIHAGRDYTDGRIVPTHGCLRVSTIGFDDIVLAAAGGEIWTTIVTEEH